MWRNIKEKLASLKIVASLFGTLKRPTKWHTSYISMSAIGETYICVKPHPSSINTGNRRPTEKLIFV
jgi:hypothetical protein